MMNIENTYCLYDYKFVTMDVTLQNVNNFLPAIFHTKIKIKSKQYKYYFTISI